MVYSCCIKPLGLAVSPKDEAFLTTIDALHMKTFSFYISYASTFGSKPFVNCPVCKSL